MNKQLKQVEEFHDVFQVGKSPDKPIILDHKTTKLRIDLLQEELNEYEEASDVGDIVGVADALTDIAYVLFGTTLAHGLGDKFIDLFDEVHSSNMSKLDKDGKPIFRKDGKVLKGDNYFKPNIKKIINE